MGFSSKFRLDFSVVFNGVYSWLKLTPSPKCSGVIKIKKCKDLVKSLILRSGVVFTPEVGMKHVDRRWKAYPARNKGKSPEFEHGVAKC